MYRWDKGYIPYVQLAARLRKQPSMLLEEVDGKLRTAYCDHIWCDLVRRIPDRRIGIIDASNNKPSLVYHPSAFGRKYYQDSIVAEVYMHIIKKSTPMGVIDDVREFYIKCYKPNYEEKLWKFLDECVIHGGPIY